MNTLRIEQPAETQKGEKEMLEILQQEFEKLTPSLKAQFWIQEPCTVYANGIMQWTMNSQAAAFLREEVKRQKKAAA